MGHAVLPYDLSCDMLKHIIRGGSINEFSSLIEKGYNNFILPKENAFSYILKSLDKFINIKYSYDEKFLKFRILLNFSSLWLSYLDFAFYLYIDGVLSQKTYYSKSLEYNFEHNSKFSEIKVFLFVRDASGKKLKFEFYQRIVYENFNCFR